MVIAEAIFYSASDGISKGLVVTFTSALRFLVRELTRGSVFNDTMAHANSTITFSMLTPTLSGEVTLELILKVMSELFSVSSLNSSSFSLGLL